MKLIDKNALVTKIEKTIDILIKNSGYIGAFGENQITVYKDVLSIINTLEVKNVEQGKQKSAKWSEEDERERKHCIDLLNHPDWIKATPTIVDNCKNWLKSLGTQNL